MSIVGLHHVQLAMPTGGESDAVDFYWSARYSPGSQASSSRGAGRLLVRGGCGPGPSRCGGRLQTGAKGAPAFLIDDLSSLRERLDSAGMHGVEDQPLPGYERFYVDDHPFGNRLEFLAER
jgi:hypothetical protein